MAETRSGKRPSVKRQATRAVVPDIRLLEFPAVIYSCEATGTYPTKFISENVVSILGFEAREFLADPQFWRSHLHPDDSASVLQELGRLPLEGSLVIEYRISRKDGAPIWIQDTMRLVRDADGKPLHIAGCFIDISRRKGVEEMIRRIDTGVSALSGERFFQSLVSNLATALRAEYALVGELTDVPDQVHTISLWAGDRLIANINYDLAHSPCADVIGKQLCVYPSGVRQQFPRDALLAEMNVESYIGMPLIGNDGRALGLMVVMDTRPLAQHEMAASVLRIFAARATAELERLKAEARLRDSHRLLQGIFDSAPDTIFVKDLQGRYQMINRAGTRALARPLDGIFGRDDTELFPGEEGRRLLAMDRQVIEGGGISVSEDVLTVGGRRVTHLATRSPLKDEQGDIIGIVGMRTDITERKRLEEHAAHAAFHDALTGLPNRALFVDRIERVFKRFRRHPRLLVAMLFLDLDRFKLINDGLGHVVADQLLEGVARRLESCVREADTVARFGGDEFAVLLEDVANPMEVLQVAERIGEALRRPFHLEGLDIVTTASIGIAFANTSYASTKELIRDADIAMYRAKDKGRGGYQVFDAEMHRQVVEKLRLAVGLRQALDRREFELHYQPIASLATGTPVIWESLLRWRHPQRGLIHAQEFVRDTEEAGLIVPIGWWAIREACRQARAWQVEVSPNPAFRVSVNLSGSQFSLPDLVSRLSEVLADTKLAPSQLQLEITETMIMSEVDWSASRLAELKSLGVGLLIDDFGTGYSSLSRLLEFPIDMLKLDRGFVASLADRESRSSAMVKGILDLANGLGIEVIAEGVESAEQAGILADLGCRYAQGNFISPPRDPDAAGMLVRAAGQAG